MSETGHASAPSAEELTIVKTVNLQAAGWERALQLQCYNMHVEGYRLVTSAVKDSWLILIFQLWPQTEG
jgi:hypothetical protein